jgi:hypothetical protein
MKKSIKKLELKKAALANFEASKVAGGVKMSTRMAACKTLDWTDCKATDCKCF